MTGGLSKNFHGVGIGPLSKILAVKSCSVLRQTKPDLEYKIPHGKVFVRISFISRNNEGKSDIFVHP